MARLHLATSEAYIFRLGRLLLVVQVLSSIQAAFRSSSSPASSSVAMSASLNWMAWKVEMGFRTALFLGILEGVLQGGPCRCRGLGSDSRCGRRQDP